MVYFIRFFSIAIGICSILACQEQKTVPTIKEIEQQALAYYQDKQSISFEFHNKKKYSDKIDTIETKRTIVWLKNPMDSSIGASIRFEYPKKNFSKVYSDGIMSYFDYKDSTRIEYANDEKKSWLICDAGYYLIPLFEGESIFDEDSIYGLSSIDVIDTLIDNRSFWMVEAKLVDKDMLSKHKKRYYFDRDNFSLNMVEYSYSISNEHTYALYKFDNLTFASNDDLFLELLESDVASTNIETPTLEIEEEKNPVTVASSIWDVSMLSIKDSLRVPFDTYKGKVMLIDFWYIACSWCRKNLPELKLLHEKYEGKIEFIGLNPIDHEKNVLRDFIKDAEMNWHSYQIAKKDAIESFNVVAYPSYIVYDDAGNEVYRLRGYSDQLVEQIDSVLISLGIEQ